MKEVVGSAGIPLLRFCKRLLSEVSIQVSYRYLFTKVFHLFSINWSQLFRPFYWKWQCEISICNVVFAFKFGRTNGRMSKKTAKRLFELGFHTYNFSEGIAPIKKP